MNKKQIIQNCRILKKAYEEGVLGNMLMPEDSKPKKFLDFEECLVYYTLPMSLNYQRNSYTLWESVHSSYQDDGLKGLFNIQICGSFNEDELRQKLMQYKIALQPNKHIHTWKTICHTIDINWGTMSQLLEIAEYDFLKLKHIIQKEYKKGFPYLSGPKIFNYWCYILSMYCDVTLQNAQYIEIAPDTHVKQCSIRLGVISEEEAKDITTEEISQKWRNILEGTGINPIDMHSPLWFWSRNNFIFEIGK